MCCITTTKSLETDKDTGVISTIFEHFYTPFLMKKPVRVTVMIIFVAALTTHTIIIPQIEIGLDQKLSMPEDSYVLKYFKVKRNRMESSPLCRD